MAVIDEIGSTVKTVEFELEDAFMRVTQFLEKKHAMGNLEYALRIKTAVFAAVEECREKLRAEAEA